MEHPGLNVQEIRSTMSIEEIQKKITDLNSRLMFASQMQNQQVVSQLYMILEAYNRAYQESLDEQFGNSKDSGGHIDIS